MRSCARRALDDSHPSFVQHRNVGLIWRVAHLHRRARLETIVELLVDLLRLPVAYSPSVSVGMAGRSTPFGIPQPRPLASYQREVDIPLR